MTEERTALVTGANRGIGFETSRQLAELGIKVFMAARAQTAGQDAADRLRAEGFTVEPVLLDVTDAGQRTRVAEMLEKCCGRLDILVNNAGMVHPGEQLFSNSSATISGRSLRETFEVNFFGLVELTQVLLPLIRKSPAGRIVNISSMLGSLGLHTDPGAGLDQIKPLAYDASKAAVNMFTVHLAALLSDTPIKVNAAHPGWVKTELGGEEAPMEVPDGALSGVALATLPADGPTGGFFHMGERMPW